MTFNLETYIPRLKACRDYFAKLYSVSDLIDALLFSDLAISKKRLPNKLPKLELSDSMIIKIQDFLSKEIRSGMSELEIQQKVRPAEELDGLLHDYRDYLIEKYGMFAYISKEWVRDLLKFLNGRPTLEIMAGNGFLMVGIRELKKGYPIKATDNFDWQVMNHPLSPVTKVVKMEASAAIEYYLKDIEVVLLAWSPQHSNCDWLILNYLRVNKFFEHGGQLIVIGEKNGATNSKKFWKQAELSAAKNLNKNWSRFDLIEDQVFIVE
ncbi:SAM-dependent methyltransferase [Oenococcus oeni]|uniref:SAM-dependent methyltransferase n=1 Tax=Oenococcus oeni TaxID=1247 RepID=UPI0008F9261A|nr:SAM-dependent methyltransferase [Oenococcus oeni]OIK79301.1 SAM-dependent methyltransferase [Oenococcus oeni]